jgi:hypothetical protein
LFNKNIFKYRTFNEYSLSELNNKTLWFSAVKDFNDPFEFKFIEDIRIPHKREVIVDWLFQSDMTQKEIHYLKTAPTSELIEGVSALVEHQREKHIRTLADRKNTRVCCLSAEYKDPLMWSHYTDGMRGFVIIYNEFMTVDNQTIPYLPVRYTDAPPVITLESIKADTFERAFDLNVSLIATKHNRWSYEKEIRLITCPNHEIQSLSTAKLTRGGILELPQDSIFGVIVGEYMDDSHFKLIETICNSKNYKMFKANTNKSSYDITITVLES